MLFFLLSKITFSLFSIICFVFVLYSVFNEHISALGLYIQAPLSFYLSPCDAQNHFIAPAVAGGGDDGNRTHYLLNAIQALSQVSYAPIEIYSQR